MFKSKGKMYVLKNHDEDGNSKLRIAEVQFLGSGKNFVFENASPYVNKIDKIMTSLTEAGVLFNYFRITKNRKNDVGKKKKWLHANDDILVKELITILSFGYILSIMTLFMENLLKYITSKFGKK